MAEEKMTKGEREDKYIELINNSPVFTLDKEKAGAAYETAKNKLVENLFKYLLVKNGKKTNNYGVEVVETAKECLNYYAPSKGEFLNYFMVAFGQRKKQANSNEIIEDEYAGAKIPDKVRKNYVRLIKYISENKCGAGIDKLSQEEITQCLKALNLSEEEWYDIRVLMLNKAKSLDMPVKADEHTTLGETVTDNNYVDKDLMQEAAVANLIKVTNETFKKTQKRQHKLLSIYLLSEFCKAFIASKMDKAQIKELLKDTTFFDEEIFEECYCKDGELTQKELAERFGKKTSDICRTIKNFEEKLKNNKKDL